MAEEILDSIEDLILAIYITNKKLQFIKTQMFHQIAIDYNVNIQVVIDAVQSLTNKGYLLQKENSGKDIFFFTKKTLRFRHDLRKQI